MKHQILLIAGDKKHYSVIERELLKRTTVEMVYAANGPEALDLARQKQPDLICLEQELHLMDGCACCKEIKSSGDLKHIPVIIVAADFDEDNIESCRASGCEEILTFPIDCRIFFDMVHTHIQSIDRRSVRIHCRLTVQFKIGHENLYGTCWNLGMHGMYVAFDGDVTPGAPVEVSFMVSDEQMSFVEAWGRVAWLNSGDKRRVKELPEGFGIEFIELSDEAGSVIRRIIEEG